MFFSGTMDCGKSTLALQMDHNHRARGRSGLTFTRHDRLGEAVLSSRLGLSAPAREVSGDVDFWTTLVDLQTAGHRIDYLICDEAQFYSTEQVEQLARVVDEMGVDVFTFGITTDFRTQLFPGSKRLIELADRVAVLQVEALCWCGARATTNARLINGVMVTTGDQVVVGDTATTPTGPEGPEGPVGPEGPGGSEGYLGAGDTAVDVVEYEVLCRRHYMRRMTSHAARAAALSPDVLPFG